MIQSWEDIVKKQLKTDDIYSVLKNENLEGITIKPYYHSLDNGISILLKTVESTHLVSNYTDGLEDSTYAFLQDSSLPNLEDKTIFINQSICLNQLEFSPKNEYFSLVDIFNPQTGAINEELCKELLGLPFVRNICVDISLHQNAGANICQQLAIALGKTKELTEVFGKDILPKLVFRMAVSQQYFLEIAKIRAFKILFNTFSKEFGLQEIPFIFVETSLRNKSKNDPENNLIRSTLELSSAMIGGADAVFCHPYLLEKNDNLSREIAFKQQIILAYESIINVFEDATNGSYFVENITQQFCEKAWKLFLEMEELGGFSQMMQNGKLSEIIYKQAIAEQNWVADGKIKLIGVNLFPKLAPRKTAEQMYNIKKIQPVRWAEMYEA